MPLSEAQKREGHLTLVAQTDIVTRLLIGFFVCTCSQNVNKVSLVGMAIFQSEFLNSRLKNTFTATLRMAHALGPDSGVVDVEHALFGQVKIFTQVQQDISDDLLNKSRGIGEAPVQFFCIEGLILSAQSHRSRNSRKPQEGRFRGGSNGAAVVHIPAQIVAMVDSRNNNVWRSIKQEIAQRNNSTVCWCSLNRPGVVGHLPNMHRSKKTHRMRLPRALFMRGYNGNAVAIALQHICQGLNSLCVVAVIVTKKNMCHVYEDLFMCCKRGLQQTRQQDRAPAAPLWYLAAQSSREEWLRKGVFMLPQSKSPSRFHWVTWGIAGILGLGLLVLSGRHWGPQPNEAESYSAAGLPLQNKIKIGGSELEDSRTISVFNLEFFMKRFVQEPHPMGSAAQIELAKDLRFYLQAFGWQSRLQQFKFKGPNLASPRFGGSDLLSRPETEVTGQNVLGYLPGPDPCVFLLGGHYDTKHFKEFRFVGANDGGSSTVLKLELARLIPKLWPKNAGTTKGKWGSCGIVLAFFDGEEAILPGWFDGTKVLGLQDNLYGSRAFVESLDGKNRQFLNKNIELAMIIDMIGHKNQKLFITEGSDMQASEQLEGLRASVKLARAPFQIDDDHVPFKNAGIPFVHVIDWTNLAEWHKETDTPAIISYEKIALFGDVLLRFLNSSRQQNLARREN